MNHVNFMYEYGYSKNLFEQVWSDMSRSGQSNCVKNGLKLKKKSLKHKKKFDMDPVISSFLSWRICRVRSSAISGAEINWCKMFLFISFKI